jgi:hypothetical protein
MTTSQHDLATKICHLFIPAWQRGIQTVDGRTVESQSVDAVVKLLAHFSIAAPIFEAGQIVGPAPGTDDVQLVLEPYRPGELMVTVESKSDDPDFEDEDARVAIVNADELACVVLTGVQATLSAVATALFDASQGVITGAKHQADSIERFAAAVRDDVLELYDTLRVIYGSAVEGLGGAYGNAFDALGAALADLASVFNALDVQRDHEGDLEAALSLVTAAKTPNTARELIIAERARQRLAWDERHDDEHTAGELAVRAAELLVAGTDEELSHHIHERDSWGLVAKHGGDAVRSLPIAGALILAELERALRQRGVVTEPGQDTGLVTKLRGELARVYNVSREEAPDASWFVCARCLTKTSAFDGGSDFEGLCSKCWAEVRHICGDPDAPLKASVDVVTKQQVQEQATRTRAQEELGRIKLAVSQAVSAAKGTSDPAKLRNLLLDIEAATTEHEQID